MSPNIRQIDNFKEKVRSNFYKIWCYYGCAIIWVIFGLYLSQTEVFLNKFISKITEVRYCYINLNIYIHDIRILTSSLL